MPLGVTSTVHRVAVWKEKQKIREDKEGNEALSKVGNAQASLIGVSESPIQEWEGAPLPAVKRGRSPSLAAPEWGTSVQVSAGLSPARARDQTHHCLWFHHFKMQPSENAVAMALMLASCRMMISKYPGKPLQGSSCLALQCKHEQLLAQGGRDKFCPCSTVPSSGASNIRKTQPC